jgi:phosphonate transport system substrate-binding protein
MTPERSSGPCSRLAPALREEEPVTAPSAAFPAVSKPPKRTAGTLRVASCLAPHLCWLYRFLAACLGDRLGCTLEFIEDASYDQLGDVDIVFVCSLAYVEHAAIRRRFEPIAAPVLAGARYGGRPIYCSDVIVRRDSTLRSFADLRGRTWAYNEKLSQSGYGITRYHLARLGERSGYFGHLIEAGRHERAIALVANGEADAAAIDSHVLETWFDLHPSLRRALRIVDSLGPSPIQPVAVRRSLSPGCKDDLRLALAEIDKGPEGRAILGRARMERFVGVAEETYDPIRAMSAFAAAGLSVLTVRG